MKGVHPQSCHLCPYVSEKLKKTTEHKSKSNDGKDKKILPNRSKLITIRNYNSFYQPKLPSKTVSSSLRFSQDGNEVKLERRNSFDRLIGFPFGVTHFIGGFPFPQ